MTILLECVNTTHDKAYDYKKVTYTDNTIKYFFVGKVGKYKTKFPNWTEAKDDKKYGTIRRNAIEKEVTFDCVQTTENLSLPLLKPNKIPLQNVSEISQTSNIISNTPTDIDPTGTVVNIYLNSPLKGAIIKVGEYSTPTDVNGSFKIPLNKIPDFSPSESPNVVSITLPGYQTLEITPYKGDGEIKDDLGIIGLTPIINSLEGDKIDASQIKSSQIEEISSSKKDFKYFAQKKLVDLTNNIKTILIPLILTLISRFGITKANKLIESNKTKINDVKDQIICPTPEELNRIISRKNKTVKQLNNAIKTIDITTKALGITEGILILLDATLFIADITPSSINPFPPRINKILSKTIDGLKATNAGLLIILVLLKQTLTQAVQYLSLLDNLIQHCYPDAAQEQISAELTALTQQQTQQLSPVVINVNGFEMGVETEVTDKPLKRRRAIARNKQGVVMLKGEWSFSSIDQILIDELVFYIQQNDLKAD